MSLNEWIYRFLWHRWTRNWSPVRNLRGNEFLRSFNGLLRRLNFYCRGHPRDASPGRAGKRIWKAIQKNLERVRQGGLSKLHYCGCQRMTLVIAFAVVTCSSFDYTRLLACFEVIKHSSDGSFESLSARCLLHGANCATSPGNGEQFSIFWKKCRVDHKNKTFWWLFFSRLSIQKHWKYVKVNWRHFSVNGRAITPATLSTLVFAKSRSRSFISLPANHLFIELHVTPRLCNHQWCTVLYKSCKLFDHLVVSRLCVIHECWMNEPRLCALRRQIWCALCGSRWSQLRADD